MLAQGLSIRLFAFGGAYWPLGRGGGSGGREVQGGDPPSSYGVRPF